ncbi:hypothetical protein [Mycobacteroides abscessus]|uniref:hypothetical protein n=1 Tax=Mycobacteroides abscessus TaxID=36809 RepID=UPI000C269029|nr:hypothetical protein [Mycobacteroides abscessus]
MTNAERLNFRRDVDKARQAFIDALKWLPPHPNELSDTDISAFTQLYGDLRSDLAVPVGLMAAEAMKRSIYYVAEPDDVDGEPETVETVL